MKFKIYASKLESYTFYVTAKDKHLAFTKARNKLRDDWLINQIKEINVKPRIKRHC